MPIRCSKVVLLAAAVLIVLPFQASPVAAHNVSVEAAWTRPPTPIVTAGPGGTAVIEALAMPKMFPGPGSQDGDMHLLFLRWTVTFDGGPFETKPWCACSNYRREVVSPGMYAISVQAKSVAMQHDGSPDKEELSDVLTMPTVVSAPPTTPTSTAAVPSTTATTARPVTTTTTIPTITTTAPPATTTTTATPTVPAPPPDGQTVSASRDSQGEGGSSFPALALGIGVGLGTAGGGIGVVQWGRRRRRP